MVQTKILIVIVFLFLLSGNAFAQQYVDMPTLMGYIADWKTGTMDMTTLLTYIAEWKTGTACVPNSCGGGCPAGCTHTEDPDCGTATCTDG